MNWFRNISVGRKLAFMTLIATLIPLTLCFGVFLIIDPIFQRQTRQEETSALAAVLAENLIAALEFDDQATAREILQSLSRHPSVDSAVLYDREGRVFAVFPPDFVPDDQAAAADMISVEQPVFGSAFDLQLMGSPDLTGPDSVTDPDRGLTAGPLSDTTVPPETASPASLPPADANQVGKLIVTPGTHDIDQLLVYRALLTAVVLLISLAIGLSLSLALQRSMIQPVYSLVESTRRVAQEKDYSLCVDVASRDEIGELTQGFNTMLQTIQASQQQLTQLNSQLELRVQERTADLKSTNTALREEMEARETLQQELVTASRQAGMAEVATGVLHNVGNVLNSVNVSSSMLIESLRRSSLATLTQASALVQEHANDLGSFLTTDPRGRHFPALLEQLVTSMNRERDEQLSELQSMIDHIDHIKEIVATQQSFARVKGMSEPVNLARLVDDAIKINDSGLRNRGVTVERQCDPDIEVNTDKHKILQILVNLVGNAKHALAHLENGDQRLTVRVYHQEEFACIEVRDNGVGIPRENLERIFAHGFTTKKEGHGFGLHSSALAAAELGGSLTAHSDGPGKGAVFTLRIPRQQAAVSALEVCTTS